MGAASKHLAFDPGASGGRAVPAGPAGATAAGNIMLQAQALGLVGSLGELRAVLAESTGPVCHEPAADDRWSKARARFAALLDDGRPAGGENRSR